MALIIDLSYFVTPFEIPNLETNPNVVSNNETVTLLMDDAEREFLINALGYVTYTQLVTAMADLPNADQKWLDLVDGAGEWQGLRYTVGGVKRSIVAEYAFCRYLYSIDEQVTQAGLFIENVKNSTRVSNWPLIVKVWNNLLEDYQCGDSSLISFLNREFPTVTPKRMAAINGLGL